MPRRDIRGLASALLPSVLAAGVVQLGHRASGAVSQLKADSSPVTLADQRSEEIILDALTRLEPGVAVIAEEATSRGHKPKVGDAFFLVDPLDGTREYISGKDDFTVNIALIESGTPIFGLIYAPARGWLFTTPQSGVAIEARVAAASSISRLDELSQTVLCTREPDPHRLVAVASRRHGRTTTDAFLARLGITSERRIGSSLKFGLLARGDADVYPRFGEINEWDTAAGHAVLAAAGGCVTIADGSDLTYGKTDRGYLNPPFVAWARRTLVHPF